MFFRRVPPIRGMLVGTAAVPSAAMAGGGDGGGVYPSADGPLDGEGGPLWVAPFAAARQGVRTDGLNVPAHCRGDHSGVTAGVSGGAGMHAGRGGGRQLHEYQSYTPADTSPVLRPDGAGPPPAALFDPLTLRAATSSRNLAFTSA